jgi:spore coat polysaccharide biosynthesis predicted glycosyltransferase SpsG
MRYVLRADASLTIGSGHVMRSSAIAEELIDRGEEVTFIGEYLEVPWLATRINSIGFSQILSTAGRFVPNPKTDVLILDSYNLRVDNDFIQRKNWKAIVTIVDELTPSYISDLMVHPGLSSERKTFSNTRVIAGTRYIPFRKSIQKSRNFATDKEVLEILVVGGGTDSFNFVQAICEALINTQGKFNAQIFTNKSNMVELDSRFTAVPIGLELDEYAPNTDLVFTTASTTSLEFIAREVPVGIGCAVDNQEECYRTLSSFGVASPIGRVIENVWEINQQEVSDLVSIKERRESLRRRCAGLVDLNGAKRIVDEILAL